MELQIFSPRLFISDFAILIQWKIDFLAMSIRKNWSQISNQNGRMVPFKYEITIYYPVFPKLI